MKNKTKILLFLCMIPLLLGFQKENANAKETFLSSIEKEVLDAVNEERAKHGLGKLTQDWELSRVARIKSQDMKDNNYFSHTSPTYGSPSDLLNSFGISWRFSGENIAKGFYDAESVLTAWMNSAGHRANILNPSFTKLGVGYNSKGGYWVQEFVG